MFVLCFFTYLFCVFDYLCTQHWINEFGIDIEANPFAIWLFNIGHGALAFFVKCFLVGVLLMVIYFFRENQFAQVGAWILFTVYLALTVYHIFIFIKVRSLK